LKFIKNIFPFAFSPRSLQTECSNAVKTYILIRSGVRNLRGKVNSLPITQIMKDFILCK
jgi:hypothetical protein